jgi:TrmH family RNA methyltransferase
MHRMAGFISSSENPRFKRLMKLVHSSRERTKLGLMVLDGVHLVAAYRDHVGSPEEVVVSRSALDNPEIRSLLRGEREPLALSDSLFRRLSTVDTPTGLLAVAPIPRAPVTRTQADACVLLEDIQDPGNLGSILRSAAAAGIGHVFISKGSAQGWSPRVLRAGMGAHFALQIEEQCDLAHVMRELPCMVVAAAQQARKSIFDVDLSGRVAFLFGNEGAGLRQPLLDAAHEVVRIPMSAMVESLNVAAAAAICLYERVRQRSRNGAATLA